MQKWLGVAAKVGLTALILAFFIHQLDFHSVLHALVTIAPGAVFAGVVVVLIQSFITAIRLLMILPLFGARLGIGESMRLTLESMFFSHTFVSFLGGDAFRIWRIRRLGLNLVDATSAVAFDRLVGILANHVLLLATLPWLLPRITDRSVQLILILLAAAGVAGFALILVLGMLRGRGGLLHKLRTKIFNRSIGLALLEASTVGRHIIEGFPRFALVLLVSLATAAANIVTFAVILMGMGVASFTAVTCSLIVPAVLEVAMLPASIAGWGLREGSVVVAFSALGLPADQALGSSVVYGLMVAAVSLIGGLLWTIERHHGKMAPQWDGEAPYRP